MSNTEPPLPPARPADCPVTVEIPVWWCDQDALGHVNNTVYIRWFETARIAYCEKVGLWNLMAIERIGPILAAVHCNFRRQLHYPDTVIVGTKIAQIGRTSLKLDHVVESLHTRTIVADGHCILVVYDYNSQSPTPVPDSMRQAIETLEATSHRSAP
jgi:acyl-CoA thioester hydrolase